jgi:hypothetical protein
MNDRAKCDRCGEHGAILAEISFDASVFGDFFETFDGFDKKIERGKIRFHFCYFRTFDQLRAEADSRRTISLVKQTLGLNEIDHELLN